MRRAGREWPDLMAHWPFTSCLVGRTSLGAAAYVLSCDKQEALMSLQACIPEPSVGATTGIVQGHRASQRFLVCSGASHSQSGMSNRQDGKLLSFSCSLVRFENCSLHSESVLLENRVFWFCICELVRLDRSGHGGSQRSPSHCGASGHCHS